MKSNYLILMALSSAFFFSNTFAIASQRTADNKINPNYIASAAPKMVGSSPQKNKMSNAQREKVTKNFNQFKAKYISGPSTLDSHPLKYSGQIVYKRVYKNSGYYTLTTRANKKGVRLIYFFDPKGHWVYTTAQMK